MFFRTAIAYLLVASLAVTSLVAAEAQVVSPRELQAAVLGASEARQQQRKTIEALFSTPQAEKAMRAVKVDANLVKNSLSALNQEELAQIAMKASQAQTDFAAGRLTERDLLWILVGIAALILVIVAVR